MSAIALASEAARNTPGAKPPDPNQTANGLTKYIPTEVITFYVATLATKDAFKAVFGEVFQPTSIYWFYVALTPIVFALTYLGTLRASKSPFPQSVMAWPWWRTIASTIAFGVWALAVPENPYLAMKPAAAPLFALGALVVSSLLSMLEPIVSPQ